VSLSIAAAVFALP